MTESDKAVMQQALDALETVTRHFGFKRLNKSTLDDTTARGTAHDAMKVLRAAIAQPEQTVEPVAWQWLDTGTFRKTLPKTAVVADWNPLFKNFSTIAQPEQPAPKDVKDAQRYRRIRNGPHSDQYGDLYAMTFQGNGDVPLNGKELDRIVDAALAIAQPEQTTNFCSRCGKLVVASHDSHTCTPPVGHTN